MGLRIGEVGRRTGVRPSTIRAWERRFGFPAPARSPGGQRTYSDGEAEQIATVRRLIAEGLTLPAAVARVRAAGASAVPGGEGEVLLFHQVLDAARQGIWVAKDGRTRYANRRMAQLLRCTLDEVFARSVFDFVAPEAMARTRHRAATNRLGVSQDFEITLRRADGSTFPAEMSTTPLQDRAGRYEGSVATVTDITQRKDAEAAARFRAALLDAVGEAVAAATPDGTITYLNPAAERLMGWRVADAIGRNGPELFAAPEFAEEAAGWHRELQGGKGLAGELRLRRRDGASFVASISSAPVLGEDGDIVGVVGVFRDMTDARRRDRERRTLELEVETIGTLGTRAIGSDDGSRPQLLVEAAEAVRRIIEVDRAALFEVINGGTELALVVAAPPSEEAEVLPAGSRSLAGYAALTRKAIAVTDARRDRRFDLPAVDASAMTSAIAAPVQGPSGVLGVVVAYSSAHREFDDSALAFLQAVANVVASVW
ncbi:MAG: PAS domain S-box protein [Acidimicrobiia bacterium]|nr:PAS domain S-box protein [Acidimicrobiia bacterium]